MIEIVDPRFCPDKKTSEFFVEDSRRSWTASEYKIGKKYGMGVKDIKRAVKKVVKRKK